jgi:hypothetical protein
MACQHERLYFGSGDYYVMCELCDASWARINGRQPEYGFDVNGKPIGADPNACDPDFRQSEAGYRVKV